jgi:hypothetical protein
MDTNTNTQNYDVNTLLELKKYIFQARREIEGDRSYNIPLGGRTNDGEWTPMDALNIHLNNVVDVLSVKYINPEQIEIQSQIREEYNALVKSAKNYKPFLVEKFMGALLKKEEKKDVDINLDDLF